MNIRFNKPYLTGKEAQYLTKLAYWGKFSGNGHYTKLCHDFFKDRYGFQETFLTTSCTDALEMSALLSNISGGDEVIMPSFTFVSTANAFVLRGAKIVFADTGVDYPNIDIQSIKSLITPRTKAIVVIHYGGVACDMDHLMEIASKHNLLVIEDAAHAVDSYYKEKPLGSIGHFGTFSFHETKNIISGEGGMLAVNRDEFIERAEYIWEKGTNRVAFSRGDIGKYEWVDVGSSYLPSEIISALLFAQLQEINSIQKARISLWENYYEALQPMAEKGYFKLPKIPSYASKNGNMFFFLTEDKNERDALIIHLKKKGIQAVFHYLPLHNSPYYSNKHDGRDLKNTTRFSNCIIRLPFYNRLSEKELQYVVSAVRSFYK